MNKSRAMKVAGPRRTSKTLVTLYRVHPPVKVRQAPHLTDYVVASVSPRSTEFCSDMEKVLGPNRPPHTVIFPSRSDGAFGPHVFGLPGMLGLGAQEFYETLDPDEAMRAAGFELVGSEAALLHGEN